MKTPTQEYEVSFFWAVMTQKVKHLVNDKTKEYGVIVAEIQALLNDCCDCEHCRAGYDSAILICTAAGDLLGTNQIGCKKKDRIIKKGCYTHSN